MLELIKSLCALSGPSGFEDDVRQFIIEHAEPFCDSVEVDALGNVICFKSGCRSSEKKFVLAAHMDEVGVIITGIDAAGMLSFSTLGGIDRRLLPGKRVYIGVNRIPGVIIGKAFSSSLTGTDHVPEVQELCIYIAEPSAAEVKEKVSVGDFGVFDNEVIIQGENMTAKAIDDRVGCAVLLSLLKKELPIDCTFAFTVQEELGTRGALAAAYNLQPDIVLVIEGTTAADLPGVPENQTICSPGLGPVVPFMDGGTLYDPSLYSTVTAIADKLSIPWQTKHMIAGGTDASAFQRSAGAVKAGGIAAAVRSIHSPSSSANVRDMMDMERLAMGFLSEMGDQYGK